MSKLGETGVVQFRDLNSDINTFQRRFVNQVRRCDVLERQLCYIKKEILKENVIIPELLEDNIPAAPNTREINCLEAELEKTESEIIELGQNDVTLKSDYMELMELKCVLEKTEIIFKEKKKSVYDSKFESMKNIIMQEAQQPTTGGLEFVAGIIQRERVPIFEQMLWRISRGNVFLRKIEVEERFDCPQTGNHLYKTVFLAFFQGDQLKTRLQKLCEGFRGSIYRCPSESFERTEMLRNVRTSLEDMNMILNKTQDQRLRVLVEVARDISKWIVMVKKMKAIYYTLNFFSIDVLKNCLIGECWVPVSDLPILKTALLEGSAAVCSTVPPFISIIATNEPPPTFNRTNKFTQGFQNLIDAYGVATYQEVNPALYTIVTFPFLFAVMFGDIGHALIMTIFSAWMVIWEKKLSSKKSNNEIWNIFFSGRYIILLMGIFSMYTGLIYNDVFAKSINIFGSGWTSNYNETTILKDGGLTLNPKGDHGDYVYPMGLDPIWNLAGNKIIFLNSYKMKLSIIFGVIHMIFGVCMSVVNHFRFKQKINIVLEFLPEIIFLILLFAYMVFMMFFKWIVYSAHNTDFVYTPGCAPSILILFINMLLFKGKEPLEHCNEYMFEGQHIIQIVFVVLALLCIPWLLLAKPLYIKYKRGKINHKAHTNADSNQELIENGQIIKQNELQSGNIDHDDEPMSEIFIHQCIHTIEYILSTISHTASYLRLWALSLAHSQLSDVLWSRIFSFGLKMPGFFGVPAIFILFIPWSFLSVAILVLMEGLSAFLHTLRLHWVEFMSKFYDGLGYAFTPFCFKTILDGQLESSDQ